MLWYFRQKLKAFATPTRHFNHNGHARHLLQQIVFLIRTYQSPGKSFQRPMLHEYPVAFFQMGLFLTEILSHREFRITHGPKLKHLYGRNLIIAFVFTALCDHTHLECRCQDIFADFLFVPIFLQKDKITHDGRNTRLTLWFSSSISTYSSGMKVSSPFSSK